MKANEIYEKSTDGKIFRGCYRKSIIYGCVLQALKESENCSITPERLISTFGLTKAGALKGMKFVNSIDTNFKINSVPMTTIINEIMGKFNAKEEYKMEVNDLYTKIQNKSSELNRARPQSIASGLIYYWNYKNKKTKLPLKEFAQKIPLSELTITKISKEIEFILDKQAIEQLIRPFNYTKEQKKSLYDILFYLKKSSICKIPEVKEDAPFFVIFYWLTKNDSSNIKNIRWKYDELLLKKINNDMEKYFSKKQIKE